MAGYQKPVPEVRQCQDPDNFAYGCVAVASDVTQFAWGVFNPATGGHWEENHELVRNWTVLKPAT